MNGELELGFLSMVKKIKNAPTFFAEELYKSMKVTRNENIFLESGKATKGSEIKLP